jgi:hypothetical protein
VALAVAFDMLNVRSTSRIIASASSRVGCRIWPRWSTATIRPDDGTDCGCAAGRAFSGGAAAAVTTPAVIAMARLATVRQDLLVMKADSLLGSLARTEGSHDGRPNVGWRLALR